MDTGIDRFGTYSDYQEGGGKAYRFISRRRLVHVIHGVFIIVIGIPPLGFILDKSIAVNSPKRLENAKILVANTCQ